MDAETAGTPLQVLVLYGQYCHALAAVRSLGRRGAVVTVAGLRNDERRMTNDERQTVKDMRA